MIISTDAAPYNATNNPSGEPRNRPPFWQSGAEGTSQSYWWGPKLSPTWGGSDNYRNNREFYAYWDNYYVSAKQPIFSNPNEPGGTTVYASRSFDDSSADGSGNLDTSEIFNGATGWHA